MPTQEERSRATRTAILDAAGRHFASVGYEGASMNAIAEDAGVSKGALYHHFPDKRSIMVAIYEELETQVVERLLRAARGEQSAVEAIRKGSHEFLRACLDERFRRLALVEAPAALGWETWRAIDAQHGLGLLQAGTAAAIEAGEMPALDPTATAHGLLAVIMEGALLIGRSDKPRRTHREVVALFDAVLDGLAVSPPRRAET